MYFKEVRLKNFRNYKDGLVSFHPKVNLITGKNAQGKTNLIESLYIMSLGKSFRTSKDREMIAFNEDYCIVRCIYVKEGRENEIEIVISKKGKAIKVDGAKISKTSQLLDNIYTVVFSPEDLKIVKDEPEKRRRFIDRELCHLKPVYYKELQSYKKILLQRNTLLKKGVDDLAMLDVWDRVLVEYGSRIVGKRKEFVEKLNILSRKIHSRITNGKEDLVIEYESNIIFNEELSNIEYDFIEKLKKSRKKDIIRGTTSFGPHKDDIKISINGIDVRHFGSQGQQRTAALSLKLAEIQLIKEEKGEDAILLLDDVLSELDKERQEFLIDTLSDTQLFITTTEFDNLLLDSIKAGYVFEVNAGRVEKTLTK
ncbi:MAG: DNA replication/repair protein RecF [Clostridiales bacterium]|nr:DNA replication/repair protein RecF [Clostridiales bacterium]